MTTKKTQDKKDLNELKQKVKLASIRAQVELKEMAKKGEKIQKGN